MTSKEHDGWRRDENRLILETPVVDIYSGPVKCRRSGVEKPFYLLDFPDWVNVVAVTDEKEMVFIRQYRYGSDQMELEIPGGVVEAGEDAVAAGCRELMEECGYGGDRSRLIGAVNPNPAIQRNSCSTVLVENARLVGEQQLDEMEDIEVILIPVEKVYNDLRSGCFPVNHGLVLNALSFYSFYKNIEVVKKKNV